MSKRPPQPDGAPLDALPEDERRLLDELLESREGLAEAQRIAHLGSWDWNIAAGTLTWSDEIYRIFGVAPQEFGATYEAFLAFVHPEDRETVEQAVTEALQDGKHYDVEHRVVRPDGEERVVQECGEVTFGAGGEPRRMLGTVQDVTEQARLRDELSRSEAYNRGLVEVNLDALLTIDLAGVITDVNEQMERLVGRPRSELIGSFCWEYAPDPEPVKNAIELVLRGDTLRDYELSFDAPDGRATITSVYASLYRNQAGEVAGIFASARDISERKRFEEEREIARFFDLALDMAGITSSDGYFVRVNPAFERALGWTAEEIYSRPFETFIHPDDVEPTKEMFQQHLHGVGAIDFENRYLSKDGSYRWLRWRTTPQTESGLVYTIARDITEEKRLQEERERALSRTKALQEVSAGLAASVTSEDALEVIFDKAFAALGAGGGSLGLITPEGDGLEISYTGVAAGFSSGYSRVGIEDDLPVSRCAREGVSLWYETLDRLRAEFPLVTDAMEGAGVKSILYLPLVVNQEKLGYIGAHFGEEDATGEEDRAFATTVAGQCAQVLSRTRLFEQRERALIRTRALQDVSAGLAMASEPSEALRIIFDQALSALGADGGSIGLLSDDGLRVETEYVGLAHDLASRLATYPIDSPLPAATCIRERRAIWIESIEQGGIDFPEVVDVLVETRAQALVCLPFELEGGAFGYLGARYREPHHFSEEERTFALTLAEQCAQALTRVRLAEQRERALERTRALQEVSASLAQAATPEDVLDIFFEQGLSAIGADASSLGLVNDDRTALEMRFAGYPEDVANRLARIPLDADLPSPSCARDGSELWYESSEALFADYPDAATVIGETGHEAVFALPLRSEEEEVIGIVGGRFCEPRRFDESVRAFARSVAGQCAQALKRVRLAEQREQALLRTGALQRVSAALTGAATPEQVLQVVFEEALSALDADSGALGLLREDGETIESHRTGVPMTLQERYATESIHDQEMPQAACVRDGSEFWFSTVDEVRVEHAAAAEILSEFGFESIVFLPLTAESETIGYLAARFNEQREFSEGDRAFARTVAEQCSQAIARARLYEQREQALHRTQALQSVSAGLTAAVTSEQVVQVVFDEALSAFGADSGALGLLGDDGKTIESMRFGLPEEVVERYSSASIDDDIPQTACVRDGEELWYSSLGDLEARYPWPAQVLRESGYESFFCLPLRQEGAPIGYIAGRFREQHAFSERDRAFARTIAEQCSQAVARARLYEQREGALARTQILQRVSAGLTRATTLEQVGEVIESEVFPVLGVKAGSVGILDEEGENLRLTMGGWESGLVGRFQLIPLEADLPGPACVRESRPSWHRTSAELVGAFTDFPAEAVGEAGLEAAFFLPLETTGRAFGFLSGFFGEQREFDKSDRSFFETVAEQCAQALARAALHDDLNESLARTEALQRVSNALSSAVRTEDVLRAVFDEGFSALAVDTGALGLVSRDRTRIAIELTRPEENVAEIAIDDPLSPGSFCIRSGEEIWIESPEEISADDSFAKELKRNAGGKAIFYVPLVAGGGESIGFFAGRIDQPHRFDENERAFARSVAGRCAHALVRARLFEERERALARTQALQRVSANLAAASTPSEVAEVVFEHALAALGTVAGRLGVLDDGGRELECLTHDFEPGSVLEPSEPLSLDAAAPGAACVRSGDEYWFESFAEIRDGFPRASEALEARGVAAAFYLPLGTERPFGFLAGAFETERSFDEVERVYARTVADQCAQALERARLHQERAKQAEAALVLDRVGDSIFRLDGDGRISTWNPAAEQITGVLATDALGKRAEEIFEGWNEASKDLEPAEPGEPVPRRSLPFVFGGMELWLSISGVRLPAGAVYAFHDVTAEHELERRQHNFIATVSHELRTPLASVYGALRTLERPGLESSDRELLLKAAVGQSERLRRLIDEILVANEAGSTQLRMRDVIVDPLEVASDVMAAARSRLSTGFELALDAPEPLPLLHADPDRLHQVLGNLVDNAIKFSPEDSCVRLGISSSDQSVVFTVSDQGPGIPAAERERIFDRFYRLDPDQTKGVGGSGLGLFICRELVERMGGAIAVDSAEGSGSIFTVELPRERRHAKRS
ncbi:MAG: GAF domain-containing protein [Gaiellaceae bacterium]